MNKNAERRRKRRIAKKAQRKAERALKSTGDTEGGRLKMSVPAERLGAAGIPQEMHVVPTLGDTPEERDRRARAALSDTSSRTFFVVVHLSKEPGAFDQDVDVSVDEGTGTSLLKAPADADIVYFDTTFGRVEGAVNRQKELASLSFRCIATSKQEVFQVYSSSVAPLIDHLSFIHDVPLFVRSIAMSDEKNKTISASYVAPFRSTSLTGDTKQFDLELKAFYALYREALTSGSVFYQFLCYSKILEGAFQWLLPRLRKAAAESNAVFPKLIMHVPDHPEYSAKLRGWVGQGIEHAYKKHLYREFRNAIAHFAEDDSDPVVTSDYMSGAEVADNLQLARSCAREVITRIQEVIRVLKHAQE